MQQVLNLLFLNHRKSLAYPENQVHLQPRPPYEDALLKPRRDFMMNNAVNSQSKSVQLNGKKAKKQIELPRPRNNSILTQKLSREEQILMKKYLKSFIPMQKESLELPPLGRDRSSRGGVTTRGVPSHATNSFYRDNISLQSNQKKLKILKRAKKKFQRCVNAVIFVARLKRACQRNQERFQQIAKLASNLNSIILKMINKYYTEILEQPFFQFGQILKKKIVNPSYKATQDIVNNMVQISNCLKASSIRKDLLMFLTLLTMQNSPLPHDYFCEFQLQRLEFKKNKFMLRRVTDQQVRMVVGILLGIKIFCNNIFYQPWNIQFLNLPKALDKRVKPAIVAYSSYFYTVITSFYKKLPTHGPKFVDSLKDKGVTPMHVVEESDQFHDRCFLDFGNEHSKITSNLSAWVHRIGGEVIRNRQKMIAEQNE